MGFEAVPEPHDEGVVEPRANTLLVLDDVLLVVLADEALQHHLHGVELPVPQRTHQVHLAEPPDRQTLAHLVLPQPPLVRELHAVERALTR